MSYEVDIIIPRFSDEIDEVQIGNWLYSVGDEVEFGQPLLELEVNKSNVELDSPATGILAAVYCWEGEEVIASERIAVIEVEDDDTDKEMVVTSVEEVASEKTQDDEKKKTVHDNLDNIDEENII